MRRIVPTIVVAVVLGLAGDTSPAHGQAACTFAQGFAELRALVGEQTVGACLEDERVNADNGNTEQQTTGGLMVWRKADNHTAFTDGGTTWVVGPNGLERRPNDERLAWENDEVTRSLAPPTRTPRPIPTLPPRGHLVTEQAGRLVVSSGPVTGGSESVPSPYLPGQTGTTGAVAPPPPAPGSPARSSLAAGPPPAPGSAAVGTATPAPAGSPATAATAAPAATPTPATPTKTPTPKPTLTARFVERPDDVDTGNDASFEVETSARKGSCSLTVRYRRSSETSIGSHDIEDGRCEWKFSLPADARTGKAKAVVTVASATGETTTIEDTFEVRKGDTAYAGSVDLEVEPTDLPGKTVEPGQEIKVAIDTNLKRKGACDLLLTWPKVGAVGGATQMPDNGGRCSWRVAVPPDVPRNSSANLLVTVRKDGSTVRTLTKDFKIAR
jgi:hypothetical protein